MTARLLDRHELRDLGTFRLDDVGADQCIHQLGDADHPPLRTEDGRRGNLPRRPARLIGRHDDLEIIGNALADAPVVTLVGPGGIGKTRLALAAARIAEVDLHLLATSREGLGLAHEQLIVVGPLDATGPGVELFNERATAADRAFDPEASRDAVEEICRRLDGVPLAIEVAAARTRSLTPADLVQRLDDRLRLLTGGRRRSVERHRTLRAAIQWSYDLHTPATTRSRSGHSP